MATTPPNQGGAAPSASPSGISPTAPANAITFALDKVAPPSILYVQRDDVLVMQAASAVASEVVTFNVRLLLTDGTIRPLQFQIRPPATSTTVTLTTNLAEGYLISCSAQTFISSGRGQTYARAFINRGAFGAGQPGLVLFADYVTSTLNVSYPNGRILQSDESAGALLFNQATQPGAGADWAITVNTNQEWRLQFIAAQLTTSATVANRVPKLRIASGINPMFEAPVNAVIPASTVGVCSWAPGHFSVTTSPTTFVGALPDNCKLSSGVIIRSITENIQAADQWSQIFVYIEQWLVQV